MVKNTHRKLKTKSKIDRVLRKNVPTSCLSLKVGGNVLARYKKNKYQKNVKAKNDKKKYITETEDNLLMDDLFNEKNETNEMNENDKEYINKCIKLSNENKFLRSNEINRNNLLKRCRVCQIFKNKGTLYCSTCYDAYHLTCLKITNLNEITDEFECKRCSEQRSSNKSDIINKSSIINDTTEKNQICFKCKKKNDKLYVCEKCKNKFDKQCFSNTKNILCDDCEKIISEKIEKIQNYEYFNKKSVKNIEKYLKKECPLSADIRNEIKIIVSINREIIKKSEICSEKLHYYDKISEKIKYRSMKSLFRGLEAKGINFSDDLVFLEKNCPSELNNALLENTLQRLSDDNKKVYYEFKKQSRQGIYAPVEVVDDSVQRFVVKALTNMTTNTIICEYSGEVRLMRDCLFDDNDSIMDLIHSQISDVSLVIYPQKFGNLARFLSGINNEKKTNKQNVYSLRVNIDGSVHILLITKKKIKKGDILYYDYNAGGYNNYDTGEFV